MKRFLLAGIAALLMLGCSEAEKKTEEFNPYRPISGLVIPTTVASGQQFVMQGRGFAEDCVIEMQLNGESKKTQAQVVGVDKSGVEVVVPASLEMGFYAIILTQDARTTTIGATNVLVNEYGESDFELYVYSGERMSIYPTSVSKQVKAADALPNSSLAGIGYPVYAEAVGDSKVYYATMGEEQVSPGRYVQIYMVGSYDLVTQAREPLAKVDGFFAMGQIDGKFHLLKADKEYEIYTLVKVENGAQTIVRTFDVGAAGGLKLYPHDLRFVHHSSSNSLIIYGNMGAGSDMGQATFTLNLATGAVTPNGGNSTYKYWFVTVADELYCFAVRFDEEQTTTQVLRITDPKSWTLRGVGSEVIASYNSGFENPVYSPVTGRVYGVDDVEVFGVLATFDPAVGKFETRKWISPGVAGYFYAPRTASEE